MRPRLQFFEQLEHAGEQFAFAARQLEREKMYVAIQERAHVFVSWGYLVLV